MTGDCHVRFCERLRGETPLCLLGEIKKQKSPSKFLLKGILCGPTWNRTKHLLIMSQLL